MAQQSKVVFLNTWAHRCEAELTEFLRYNIDADVMCLTEVTEVFQAELERHGTNSAYDDRQGLPAKVNSLELLEVLSDSHTITYADGRRNEWPCKRTGKVFKDVGFGSALLLRRTLDVFSCGEERITYGTDDTHSKVLQWVVYQKQDEWYLIAHFHGVWIKGNTKGDHAIRFEQSRQVRAIITRLMDMHRVTKVILGGDFNLDITTESLRLLCEGEGESDLTFTNLIAAMGISNTRTTLYREYDKDGACLYADYVLMTKTVKLDRLEVQNDILASDHAPLLVTFT